MKNLLRFATLLCSFLALIIFSQCTSDRPISPNVKPAVLITSAEQLAADTSFIEEVKINRRITKILFNQLRLLGNNEARRQQSATITRLLNERGKVNHAKELAEQFGFANENDFNQSTYSLFKRRIELDNHYQNFDKLDRSVLQEAYSQAIAKLELSRPQTNDFGICAECPFNNCSECFGERGGGQGGCLSCVDAPGGGGGTNCRNACNSIRISSRNVAELTIVAELSLACPGVTIEVTELALCLGPVAAGAGGTCTYLFCASSAYVIYLNNISLAENNYTVCVNGCN